MSPALHMANSYVTEPGASFSAENLPQDAPMIYTRWGNPTVAMLERRIASLEDAEDALCFSSGEAAITGLFSHLLGAGDHLVMSDVAYAGAVEYTHELLPQMGVEVTHVDMSSIDAVHNALRPNTRLVHMETPCNPILRLADIAAIAALTHRAGAALSVDSTYASPMITKPLTLGADYVIHSLTKYLGGHGDALGGVVAGRRDHISSMRTRIGIRGGAVLSPFNAWLILRGLCTLPLRMREHCQNAAHLAAALADHPRITRVMYPGLPSHPQAALAQRQMKLPGGMLTFQIANGEALVTQLQEKLKIVTYAVSLGHVHSLLFYIGTGSMMKSTFHLSDENLASYRSYAGDGVFRMSVGLEDPEDLLEDLVQALD